MLDGAAALLAEAGVKDPGGNFAANLDGTCSGALSLLQASDAGGRPAVIEQCLTAGMARLQAQKVAGTLAKVVIREGRPLVLAGALPSADVVPLPIGWRARVFLLSDIHVDHEANRAWLRRAATRLPRKARTVDVLVCSGDLCDDLGTLRDVLTELRSRFDHVVFTPGNHDLWVRRKHIDSVEKLKSLLRVCADVRCRCSPLWLRGARPNASAAARALLPASRVLALQEDVFALAEVGH